MSCSVYKMSENCEKCRSMCPKGDDDDDLKHLVCPQPKDFQFIIAE